MMSLYGPIELNSELAQDAIANCAYCGAPATGGYSLGWQAAWSCDKPECRKKLEEAAVAAVERERKESDSSASTIIGPPYRFRERLGDYEREIGVQTLDELKALMNESGRHHRLFELARP